MKLNEPAEKYKLFGYCNIDTKYSNRIVYLLKDIQKICMFINQFTGENEETKVSEETLEYIDYIKEKKSIRVIYRKNQENIFFLIIYQKEIHFYLPYHILNYCMKIIQKYKDEFNLVESIIIVPIVIFLEENQHYNNHIVNNYFQLTTYDNHILELKYNLINAIDICKISENILLEDLICIENLNTRKIF